MTQEEKTALINDHQYKVRIIASKVMRTLPWRRSIQYEELISLGTIGLVRAAERYDPNRGISFSSYSDSRIRGEMLDGLRTIDPLSRKTRQLVVEMNNEVRVRERALGRELTLAERYEMRPASMKFHLVFSSLEASSQISDKSQDIVASIEASERKRMVTEAIERLPERYGQVVRMYYYNDMLFKEIGLKLGVVESRISQIHKRALEILREDLGGNFDRKQKIKFATSR